MDGSRFDRITRALAIGQTRRRTLQGIFGGTFAGLLGLAGVEDAAAACVKPGKKGCDGPKNKKCCDGAICKGGSNNQEGRCRCKGKLKQCDGKCVNINKDDKHCGKCNKKCTGQNTCKNGKCTSKLGCKAGQNLCKDGLAALCPGRDDCGCLTDVNGTARCSDFAGACADCTKNSDCPDGFVCIDASSLNFCGCPGEGEGTGNACVSATCDGISGSGASGRTWRSPLFR